MSTGGGDPQSAGLPAQPNQVPYAPPAPPVWGAPPTWAPQVAPPAPPQAVPPPGTVPAWAQPQVAPQGQYGHLAAPQWNNGTQGYPAPVQGQPTGPPPGYPGAPPQVPGQYPGQYPGQVPPGYQVPGQPPTAAPYIPNPEELANLYRSRQLYEESQRAAADQARQAEQQRILAQAEHGRVQEAFQQFQANANREAEQLRTTLAQGEVRRVVAEAVAGIQFVSAEARDDAMQVLRNQISGVVDPTTHTVVVRDLAGRPALESLRELVHSPRFAHYRAPSTQGGTIQPQFHQGRPNPQPVSPVVPGSHADMVNQVRMARGLPPLPAEQTFSTGQQSRLPQGRVEPTSLYPNNTN